MSISTTYEPRYRVERLIALGRVILACFSLVALLVDPTHPADHARSVSAIVAAYALYATTILVVVRRASAVSAAARLGMHAVDLALAGVLVQLTDGPTSLFFVYFVFALFGAALRWPWRGTLWTSAVVFVEFVAVGVHAGWIRHDPEFELNRFIVRLVYLGIVSAFLCYLGWYAQRRREEIERLAAWPLVTARDLEGVLDQALAYAMTLLASRRTLLVWEREDEPWVDIALRAGGAVTLTRDPPGAFEPLLAPAVARVSWLTADVTRGDILTSDGRTVAAPVLPAAFVERFAIQQVLAVPLAGTDGAGLLLFLDRVDVNPDDLLLAEVVARQVVAILEHHLVIERLRAAAVAQERLRFAGNLHDGILQALTGARLQLQATARVATTADRSQVRGRLLAIEAALATEQRELHAMIQQLRPFPRVELPSDSLNDRLAALQRRVEIQWGIAVSLDVAAAAAIPAHLAADVYLLVQEALINAARHARASAARVAIAVAGERVRIVVADDGKGFGFLGRRGLHDLGVLAPSSLAERVTALGGTLEVESHAGGATVELDIPVARGLT